MKRLAVSLGEVAGIGPDIIVQLAQQQYEAELVVFGDKPCLLQRAQQLNLPLTLVPFVKEKIQAQQPSQLSIKHIPLAQPVIPGQLNVNNSAAVMHSLDAAIQACLDGNCHALITAPIHKAIIAQAGFEFCGHTEYLAQQCGVDNVTMFFISEDLYVSLQTTHLPLQAVPIAIKANLIQQRLKQVNDFYQQYIANKAPRIAICGLNPHAGENGLLGREEIDEIIPAINICQRQGLNVQGPFSADSLFSANQRQHFDIIHAMYHDQGLTAFKALSFKQGINATCGLPFLRCSVDHGTALTLAGTGKTDSNNIQYVINKTLQMLKPL